MAVIQSVIDLVDILSQQGLEHAIICPGSRSAAITLSFARNSRIKTTVSIDERTAGFIGLGMAVELQKPVAIICTSGTAAYNFSPAVAEAFFLQVPLIVITADRPKEWIHQQDGQTIYQSGLFGRHVKEMLEFPVDTTHADSQWYANRISNQAFLTANTYPKGPVHLNVPIREPFYPSENESFSPSAFNRIAERLSPQVTLPKESWHRLQDEWESADKILIASGQGVFSQSLADTLRQITEEWEIPVIGDVTANLGSHPEFIGLQDVFLLPDQNKELAPDLLITFGQSFLSKKLKHFLRENPAVRHWHVGLETNLIDTFQSLTLQIPVMPDFFFHKMLEDIDFKRFVENQEDWEGVFKQQWIQKEYLAARIVNEHITSEQNTLSDLSFIQQLVSRLPENALIHIGNSMPVRHANILRRLGLVQNVWANRGTSGIDGCVSTAIGSALVTQKLVFLLVGDVSFLYDRNGFLIENFPLNLKIVVLNNGGGNIFRMIDGPRKQPELERFFETRHQFTAESTALDARISYLKITQPDESDHTISEFIDTEGPALLEIFTDPETNRDISQKIKQAYMDAASRS